ncbi:hypothetical protein AB0I77_47020 [Streptomyces sp. NPDC050619]|uniref:hypothetical protein n=1 Tax=Streptomyces sp. NPDC050619 TaxID=3157214 RepID=UPI0034227D32
MSAVKTYRRVGLGVALPLLTAAATLLAAYPAAAAPHNIVIRGSSIPSNARSVLVSTTVSHCVPVQPGTDKDTNFSVDDAVDDGYFIYQTWTGTKCDGSVIKSQGANIPRNFQGATYWLNVS